MYVSRILYPVKVLGPGQRIGIWMSGCIHKCPGCSNPELWSMNEKSLTTGNDVMRMIHSISAHHPIDGFTITGGDPFLQPEALRELLPQLAQISEDILVYTGYQYEQLSHYEDILKYVSVLIDGPYIEERNHGEPLRGSDNQRIFFLKKSYKESYKPILSQENSQIQNFNTGEGIISVGIHLPNYPEQLIHAISKKGLEVKQ